MGWASFTLWPSHRLSHISESSGATLLLKPKAFSVVVGALVQGRSLSQRHSSCWLIKQHEFECCLWTGPGSGSLPVSSHKSRKDRQLSWAHNCRAVLSCMEPIQFHWKRSPVLSSYCLFGVLAPCYSKGIAWIWQCVFPGGAGKWWDSASFISVWNACLLGWNWLGRDIV